jgi:hypothetical protein
MALITNRPVLFPLDASHNITHLVSGTPRHNSLQYLIINL